MLVFGICIRIWTEKLGWCKANAALGITWNTGKIKSQKVFLSSCSFLSSEWVASRIHWGWFLALRHLTLPVAWQEEQDTADKMSSGGQKQRPGSQGRKLLCGTEQVGLWEKIALVAIYQSSCRLKSKHFLQWSMLQTAVMSVAFVEHINNNSEITWCGFSLSVMCISSRCLNILCRFRNCKGGCCPTVNTVAIRLPRGGAGVQDFALHDY